MVGGDNFLWADVRRAYEGDELTVAAICRKFAVTPRQITERRVAEGWLVRPFPMRKGWAMRARQAAREAPGEAPGGSGCEPGSGSFEPGSAPPSGRDLASDTVAAVRAGHDEQPGRQQVTTLTASTPGLKRDSGQLIARLFTAIETELTIIEERMKDRENRSPADSERDTRSIGALIRNLEKLTEFDGQRRDGGDKSGALANITADEADRIRRDLAARIERITKGSGS